MGLSFWTFIGMLVAGVVTLGGLVPFVLGLAVTLLLGFISFKSDPGWMASRYK